MSLLRFTNPTNIPAYIDWDFVVLAADIVLRTEDLCAVYAEYLDEHRRNYSNIPKDWGRYAEAQRVAELYSRLVEACKTRRDLTLEGDDVWAYAKGLMFGKRFVSARCPKCVQEFGPELCRVLTWWSSRSGGCRVVCPAEHTLYSCGLLGS